MRLMMWTKSYDNSMRKKCVSLLQIFVATTRTTEKLISSIKYSQHPRSLLKRPLKWVQCQICQTSMHIKPFAKFGLIVKVTGSFRRTTFSVFSCKSAFCLLFTLPFACLLSITKTGPTRSRINWSQMHRLPTKILVTLTQHLEDLNIVKK